MDRSWASDFNQYLELPNDPEGNNLLALTFGRAFSHALRFKIAVCSSFSNVCSLLFSVHSSRVTTQDTVLHYLVLCLEAMNLSYSLLKTAAISKKRQTFGLVLFPKRCPRVQG